jgi:hypothetical protein
MRVLDIYENFCWSFECDNSVALRQLRSAAALPNADVRDRELDSIPNSHAYRLVGDAVAFDLADDYFDEISVEYPPSLLKRILLGQKLKRWLKPEGNLLLPPENQPPEAHENYVPLRRPTYATA